MKRVLFGLLLAASAMLGASAGAQAAMGAHTVAVTITNTTSHQAFSAPVVVSHSKDYLPFALGEPVYPELVPLAEDGMTGEFVTVAKVDTAILDYAVAMHALPPGQSVTLTVRVDDAHPLLSVFGMMVTTNDTVFYYGTDLAMAGAGSGGAGGMGSGEMAGGMGAQAGGADAMAGDGMTATTEKSGGADANQHPGGADMAGQGMMAHVDLYDGTVRALDAGSEANTESCRDIPGPPCGSVGVRHPAMAEGVVGVSHGLTGTGDLAKAVYGWNDPVATVTLSTP